MKDATRMNFFLENSIREKLEILAGEARQSRTAYIESLIDAEWQSREIRAEERKVLRGPFPQNAPAATSPAATPRVMPRKKSTG